MKSLKAFRFSHFPFSTHHHEAKVGLKTVDSFCFCVKVHTNLQTSEKFEYFILSEFCLLVYIVFFIFEVMCAANFTSKAILLF